MSKKKSKKYKSWAQVCQPIYLWCVALSEINIFTCLQLCWSALLESPNHLKTNQQSKMNLQLLSTDNSYESKQSFAFESHDQHITTEMNVWFALNLMFWIYVAYFRPKIGVLEYWIEEPFVLGSSSRSAMECRVTDLARSKAPGQTLVKHWSNTEHCWNTSFGQTVVFLCPALPLWL